MPRTDWRFLLPTAPDGAFRHLVLLGGGSELVDSVLRLDIARRVSTEVLSVPVADAVVRLHGATHDLAAAAGCLVPGGVMYFEILRRRPGWKAATPERVSEDLARLGLAQLGIYWVRDSFYDPRVYLPTDCPAAIAWYFSRARYCSTWFQRLGALYLPTMARLGARALLARRMHSLAVVAVRGEVAAPAPGVLSLTTLPSELQDPTLRSVVLAPRLQRVVVLPFAAASRVPLAVVKVARFALRNARTENEQAVLATIRGRLDERLRPTVPKPWGLHRLGDLAVGVESYLQGHLLGRSREPWAVLSARKHFEDLRAVAKWLADFHRQTQLRAGTWDEIAADGLEAVIGEYQRAFGTSLEESKLFTTVRALSRSLLGVPLPRVWRHCDLTPRNTCRTVQGIGVIDWEHGIEGYPLLDLLHFVEEWLYNNAPKAPDLPAKVRRFHQVFVRVDARDPWTREVQTAVQTYMKFLGLDTRFYPLLHVLLRLERAVTRFRAVEDPDNDWIALQMVDRYVAYVRALAAGAENFATHYLDAVPEQPAVHRGRSAHGE